MGAFFRVVGIGGEGGEGGEGGVTKFDIQDRLDSKTITKA